MEVSDIKQKRGIQLIFLLMYLLTVLWFTVLKRSTGYQVAQLELFWSYRKWFAGDTDLGREILANIAMCVPLGFLLSAVFFLRQSRPDTSRIGMVGRGVAVLALAAGCSLTIEVLQLYLMRGLFEWDDVFSNTLGAGIGMLLLCLIHRILPIRYRSIASTSISLVFVLVCLGVYLSGRGAGGVEVDTTSRAWCFQIEACEITDGTIALSGFAFRYDHPEGAPELLLQSTETGERVRLTTVYGLARPDVNEYFHCDRDYTRVGFTAGGKLEDGEYEVLIQWPWSIPLSTGVFVGDTVHYVRSDAFTAPEMDAEFITNGVLRVYCPEYHCWVYQYQNHLYWVVDESFAFEEDGTTYIQYQLWTTQTEKLPEKRLARNKRWDSIAGSFEKHEVEGDWGGYRVMKRKMPAKYSIISISTGSYKDGEWIWKVYFRPYYEFGDAGASNAASEFPFSPRTA